MSTPTTKEGLRAHEQVRLWRLRMGVTRKKAARFLGIASDYTWGEYERGERRFPQELPWTGPDELKRHERCRIARLRSGQSQKHIAAELSLSRDWVGQMERGAQDPRPLEQYWNI